MLILKKFPKSSLPLSPFSARRRGWLLQCPFVTTFPFSSGGGKPSSLHQGAGISPLPHSLKPPPPRRGGAPFTWGFFQEAPLTSDQKRKMSPRTGKKHRGLPEEEVLPPWEERVSCSPFFSFPRQKEEEV